MRGQQGLRARQLELALLAHVMPDVVAQAVEDGGCEDLHTEKAQILPRRKARRAQLLCGSLRAGLLDHRRDAVQPVLALQRLAAHGAEEVQQVLRRALDRGDGLAGALEDVHHLAGAAAALRIGRDVHVIAE